MTDGIWTLERCASERFPYRLQIQKEETPWLILRTQDRWPAVGKNIFSLGGSPPKADEIVGELGRVAIVPFYE